MKLKRTPLTPKIFSITRLFWCNESSNIVYWAYGYALYNEFIDYCLVNKIDLILKVSTLNISNCTLQI